ncbi:MAG: hypothetical protein PVJ09_02405 [Candidatus Woesebacteria bacterium]|jgi:hypothetical protein
MTDNSKQTAQRAVLSSNDYLEKLRKQRAARQQPRLNPTVSQQFSKQGVGQRKMPDATSSNIQAAPSSRPLSTSADTTRRPTVATAPAEITQAPTPPKQTAAAQVNNTATTAQANAGMPAAGDPKIVTPAQQAADYELPDVEQEKSKVAPGWYKPLPEQTILEWEAPSRPFKKRKKQFFTTVAVIALLVSLILIFAGQGIFPVAVVISVSFLVYVLSVIPPGKVKNQLTTYGIKVDKNLYYWEELGRFWYTKKFSDELLQIETIRFPGRITLLLANQDKQALTDILSEVLLQEKPELTFYEKASKWLQKKIPLEVD